MYMYVKKNIPKSTFEFTCTSIFVNQHCSFTNLFVPTFAIGHVEKTLSLNGNEDVLILQINL